MNNDQKRMFLAIGLSAAVLFIWQAFFAPPQPVRNNQTTTKVEKTDNNQSQNTVKTATETASQGSAPIEPAKDISVETFTLNSNQGQVSLSNDLTIVNYANKDAKYDFQNIVGENKRPFELFINEGGQYKPVVFEFTQTSNTVQGKNSKLGINFIGNLDEEGRFKYTLTSAMPYKYRIVFSSEEKTLDNRQMRMFAFLGGNDVERFDVGDEDTFDGQIRWVGVDFNFHLFAQVFSKKHASRITNKDGKLIVDIVQPTQSLESYFVFVKKNYDLLAKLGDQLELSVDFGIFGILAVPILRGIQFCYKYFPNYGIGIILLTILLRIVTFPLYYKSIVSMKKMQKVQPELTKLREKFKDDPQRMQKETMELFKRAGANPLGGCFPMLLQMPIFFAFYQVLYNAVELVNAPFVGWITDLSTKDPLYILPVAMAVAMFAQQKLTPTTSADPTQQKIMMAMPIIFGFIMKDLPSGLVLYIFVSTLFGIIQQLVVYKATD